MKKPNNGSISNLKADRDVNITSKKDDVIIGTSVELYSEIPHLSCYSSEEDWETVFPFFLGADAVGNGAAQAAAAHSSATHTVRSQPIMLSEDVRIDAPT